MVSRRAFVNEGQSASDSCGELASGDDDVDLLSTASLASCPGSGSELLAPWPSLIS